jgi:hypothetical protein
MTFPNEHKFKSYNLPYANPLKLEWQTIIGNLMVSI